LPAEHWVLSLKSFTWRFLRTISLMSWPPTSTMMSTSSPKKRIADSVCATVSTSATSARRTSLRMSLA